MNFCEELFHEYNAFSLNNNIFICACCDQAHGQKTGWGNATI